MPVPRRNESRARSERMVFRVDHETKAIVESAARAERRSLTDYCLTALAAAAKRTLAESETLRLSEQDRAAFFEALINPPALNDRLRRAASEHARRVEA